jgi:hypothetical protein
MEPPVFATASAGILMFSLIRRWLNDRAGSCFKRCYAANDATRGARARR